MFVLLVLVPTMGLAVQCPFQTGLLDNPANPAAKGPYPVSSRLLEGTFTARNLTVEVFFPAQPGSEAGAKPMTIDLRDFLTESIAKRIPEKDVPHPFYDNAWVGLPPAWGTKFAPNSSTSPLGFPTITFVHGTAGWRSQSLSLVVHWASRGFVIVAADYPGIVLHDLLYAADHPLKKHPHVDQVGDTRALMKLFRDMNDPRITELLGGGVVNMTNNALIGHSAGALALEHLGGEAAVVIPMAGAGSAADGPSPSSHLRSTLVLGAHNDSEVPPKRFGIPGYRRSGPPKRLVIGANMGHQAFSDLCYIGEDQGGIVGIGEKLKIWEAFLFAPLATDGCKFHNPKFFTPQKNWALIEFSSSAVLEETLRCDGQMSTQINQIESKYNYIASFNQQLSQKQVSHSQDIIYT